MLNWSEHEEEKLKPRPIILPLLAWLAFIGFSIVLLTLAVGCATEQKAEPQVCYLKLMGQTEEGYTVVMQACVTPEQFKAAQK